MAIQSGVSRQTVNDWIKGQIPKGNHLIALCKIFQVQPDDFFSVDMESSITLPVHRARKTAKVNRDMQSDAIQLATEYELLFKNEAESSVVPVIRVGRKNNENAKKIYKDLRLKSGIGDDTPIDYDHTFILMDKLGIYIIFRKFPEAIKASQPNPCTFYVIRNLLESGKINQRTQKFFNLIAVDRKFAACVLAHNFDMTTGDNDSID